MENGEFTGAKLLRLGQVISKIGLSRSTIYQRLKEGRFPRPISLGGGRAVAWLESEVDDWIKAIITESRKADARFGNQTWK